MNSARSPISLTALIAVLCLAPVTTPGQEKSPAPKEKKKKWAVTDTHGPVTPLTLALSEGTWINLDISPNGSEIVFDLLGDLYLMPISGGKAKAISQDPAYEVQPRFSPDGSKISFTSDRGGGDNIWIMNRDGSEKKAISSEDFRLLNNAVWSPDGQYLVARKHFTSRRSLGAGEMWMFHVSGGKGLLLTKRRNDQQDAGEPCFSHDGRYIYYSEDMTGGGVFQYNKDPNGQIYVIRRLDRETGKLTNFITGSGGAVRPQASPDGRYISFVRRVRTKSVLYLHDLQTGEQWPIYDQLSKDQQETWAIFGVYPNMAWTPDSKSIVFWAKGKIWRIEIADMSVAEIPFEVEARLEITESPRFRQNVSPDNFEVKMVRHPATSPDGRWLVFNGAGHLWKKALPDGSPVRLTKDNHFEFEPAFSNDGQWVVYTTWDDGDLGAIYKVRLDGKNPQKLTPKKGYYRTPSFSRDGKKIVYAKVGGNGTLGFTHAVDPGLYWMSADGRQHHFIQDNGSNPRFTLSGERIFFMGRASGKKALRSVGLNGQDERTHFTSQYATTILPSPDERWVAFRELFNAYIAPLAKTGGAVDLSGKTKAIPVTRVTRDAGDYLHWSADSRQLHWTIGPEYYSRELTQSFAFVPGASDSLPPMDSTGIAIGLTLESDKPRGVMALTGARIITMNGDEVIQQGTILVRDNRISAIGAAADIAVPGNAVQIDVSGKTIMPGMIDVHAHLRNSNGLSPQQQWSYYANLAYGVTTTHDPSSNTEMVFSQSEMVRAGRMVGPRVFSTGTILYGAEGDFKAVVNSLDDARSHLRRMKAVGAFSVKSYNQPRRDQRQQIIQAARELEMMVVPEGGSFFYHNMSMILDGHTGIEHAIPIAPIYQDAASLWGASQTGYTPTLVVAYGGIWGENYWYQKTNVWEKSHLLNFVPRAIVDARSRRRMLIPDDDFGHIDVAKVAKQVLDAGGKVQLGSHGQMQGLAAHWELWMFVQGGMTSLEAIRAATLHGAYYLGLDGDIGSLEVGKLADLVVLGANPLIDITHTEQVEKVMINGRLYDARTMNEMGHRTLTRKPFYWEHAKTSDAFVWRGDGIGFQEIMCACGAN